MKHIGNISPSKGSVKGIKRIGRGAGSGHGGTSTRDTKVILHVQVLSRREISRAVKCL